MDYGTKDLDYLIPSDEDPIVKCTNCDTYHYESLGSETDTLYLQLLHEDDDPEGVDPYKGCGNCRTDSYLMDVDPPKKPKIMVVGMVDHGITTHAARMLAMHNDIEVITPEQAREMGVMGEIPMLPYPEPAPIPILEEPLTIIPRKDYLLEPKSGRQERREKRKKNKKRNRRY